MTLYEITDQYKQLVEMAEEVDPDVLADTLEGIEGELEEKAENYAKVIRTLEVDLQGIKGEVDRLTKRKKMIENNIDRIKRSLQEAMISVEKRKFKTQLFNFSIRKNPPSVRIIEGEVIPNDFWKQPSPVLDKESLKSYLKDNGNQEYAELVQTESLSIR